MLTTLTKIIVTTALSFLAFSCNVSFNGTEGKGAVTSKNIPITESFTKISAEKGWDVILEKASTAELEIHAHQNLIDIFEYKVEDNTLIISAKNNIGSAERKEIIVHYTENLQRIKASSGTELTSREMIEQENIELKASSGAEVSLELKTASAEIEASSGAEINLQGTVINCKANVSSGAEIEAKKLRTKTANLKASSGGDLEMSVEKEITASSSSGGSIDYYGNPEQKNIKESTSGGDISQN
ncbi:head GIN domain-containing protein [Mesonia maritima]|uniref:Putative auto-transporter adhesin head GIN domain-containing protein n=1 Tax=Mesonia maritima TaxID=1793873 RepID=A0ABU1K5I5_9FLAO|nr:head GIN domain-containing protein [Mesonia maritima]MDR6300874.1 hypothetical protein [Mesonia maritima]